MERNGVKTHPKTWLLNFNKGGRCLLFLMILKLILILQMCLSLIFLFLFLHEAENAVSYNYHLYVHPLGNISMAGTEQKGRLLLLFY